MERCRSRRRHWPFGLALTLGLTAGVAAIEAGPPQQPAEAAQSPAVIDTLIDATAARDADGRRQAATALGIFAAKRAVPALIEALDDTAPGVRAAAAWALGVIRDPQATEPLKKALGDRDGTVRVAAAEALAVLLDPDADPEAFRSYRTRAPRTAAPGRGDHRQGRPNPSPNPNPNPRPRPANALAMTGGW